MPFALKTAPVPYRRLMNKLLQELIDEGKVLVYLDDVVLFSRTDTEHVQTPEPQTL